MYLTHIDRITALVQKHGSDADRDALAAIRDTLRRMECDCPICKFDIHCNRRELHHWWCPYSPTAREEKK